MDIQEILYKFSSTKNLRFPKEAFDEAVTKQAEITPILLNYIEIDPTQLIALCDECEERSEGTESDFRWVFAVYLFAQFRCEKAFQPIINFFSFHDQEVVHEAVGDFITESLPSILASVFDGDPESLFKIINDRSKDSYIRNSFLHATMILVLYEQLDIVDMIPRYKELFDSAIASSDGRSVSLFVSTLSDLSLPDLRENIDKAYDKNLVDLDFLTREDIDYIYDNPPLKGSRYHSLVDDSYATLKTFAWFVESSEVRSFFDLDMSDETLDQFIKEEQKIGRNEPCPCGSGKKYKKCCLH